MRRDEERGYAAAKRTTDSVIAALLLLFLSPVMAVVALAVLAAHGRPVLFRQTRPGLHARPFTIYKFRTMIVAEAEAQPKPDSARLTRFGRLLRATSLDELPQLINVLRGDMSFIGPRPLLPEYLDLYTPEQARRHLVRPGMTGLAQTRGRNAASWSDRLRWDTEYVERMGPSLDMKIVVRSIAVVMSRTGISAEGEATVRPLSLADEATT